MEQKRFDEEEVVARIEAEMRDLIEDASGGRVDPLVDKTEIGYHTLLMRLRQNQVSCERLARLVVNTLKEAVSGLRNHTPEAAEQVLCKELAILNGVIEAELAAKYS